MNLYATGATRHPGANAGSGESCCCYKIIATDLGLGKPWEEPGKDDPDSLAEQLWTIRNRVRASAGKPWATRGIAEKEGRLQRV